VEFPRYVKHIITTCFGVSLLRAARQTWSIVFDVVQISVRIPVAHALVVVFLIVWALNPYLGFRTTGSFTMFSGLVTEGPGTNHFFMPSVHLVEYQNELLAPIWSTNERLHQLADDGQLVTVFETRRLLEDDPGATLVAHLDDEIVRLEGDSISWVTLLLQG